MVCHTLLVRSMWKMCLKASSEPFAGSGRVTCYTIGSHTRCGPFSHSLNCRYLQLNRRYLQLNWRYLQILPIWRCLQLNCRYLQLNFNFIQRALVLEDYAPALGVRGFVSRKNGARSTGEDKKEGKNNNIK